MVEGPIAEVGFGRRIVEDLGHEEIIPERNYKKDMWILGKELGWKIVKNKWVKK